VNDQSTGSGGSSLRSVLHVPLIIELPNDDGNILHVLQPVSTEEVLVRLTEVLLQVLPILAPRRVQVTDTDLRGALLDVIVLHLIDGPVTVVGEPVLVDGEAPPGISVEVPTYDRGRVTEIDDCLLRSNTVGTDGSLDFSLIRLAEGEEDVQVFLFDTPGVVADDDLVVGLRTAIVVFDLDLHRIEPIQNPTPVVERVVDQFLERRNRRNVGLNGLIRVFRGLKIVLIFSHHISSLTLSRYICFVILFTPHSV